MTESVREIYTVSPPSGPWVITRSTPEGVLSFSPDSEIPEVQDAIVAIGESAARDQDGSIPEGEISFDLSRIPEERLSVVVEGARQIREDKELPREVRKPAIELLQAIKEAKKPDKPVQEIISAKTPRIKKSTLLKQARKNELEEMEQLHRCDRQQEILALLEWRKDTSLNEDNSFVKMQSKVKTRLSSSGEIIVVEDTDLEESIVEYIDKLLENPSLFKEEGEAAELFEQYFATHKSPILHSVYEHIKAKNWEIWHTSFYDPSILKEAFVNWGNVFRTFPTIYKANAVYTNSTLVPQHTKGALSLDSSTHFYGLDALRRSLVNAAREKPDEFIDLVHEITNSILEEKDPFVRQDSLHLIANTLSQSALASIAVMNVPLLREAEELQKMKSLDLKMALLQAGCHLDRLIMDRNVPKQFKKYNVAGKVAKSLGIDIRKPSYEKELYKIVYDPIATFIKEGGMPGSLYLKIKKEQQALALLIRSPEDA